VYDHYGLSSCIGGKPAGNARVVHAWRNALQKDGILSLGLFCEHHQVFTTVCCGIWEHGRSENSTSQWHYSRPPPLVSAVWDAGNAADCEEHRASQSWNNKDSWMLATCKSSLGSCDGDGPKRRTAKLNTAGARWPISSAATVKPRRTKRSKLFCQSLVCDDIAAVRCSQDALVHSA
jgi:hypothetical protein